LPERPNRENEETAKAVHADLAIELRKRKRLRMRVLGGALVLAVPLLALVAVSAARRGVPASPATPQSASPSLSPVAAVSAAPLPTAAAPVPIVATAEASPATASPPMPTAVPRTDAKPKPVPDPVRATVQSGNRAPRPTKANDCAIPFTIEPDGTKRFKPQCF
jgi:hypothetical protein